jgi:nucleoside 2-deoxyribosyltransferase
MKKILVFILLFHSLCLPAEEPISIYLCSRLTEEARNWNDVVTKELQDGFIMFRPQDIDLNNLVHKESILNNVAQKEFDLAVFKADLAGMQSSDMLLVLPPYGRDCAWEIGWFSGQEKPAIAYAENEGPWLGDAMVKGGLTAIVTNNPALYDTLMADTSTSDKSYLIQSKACLGEAIRSVYVEHTRTHFQVP